MGFAHALVKIRSKSACLTLHQVKSVSIFQRDGFSLWKFGRRYLNLSDYFLGLG